MAQEDDIPAVERFLYEHVQSSMFPLANLHDFGLNGTYARSVQIWLLGDDLRGVFAITNEGMVLPQCPDCCDAELVAATDLVRDREILGVIGEATQTRRIMRLAGWSDRATQLDHDEPAFSLELASLIIPELPASRLVPLSMIDHGLAVEWRRAYLIETLGVLQKDVTEQAKRDIDSYLSRDSHRVLLVDGEPVGMTGFNAVLSDVVQIGGVYTPPHLRGLGYARQAVALHLNEARASGVSRAVLFAASNFAARAYVAIGFVRAGDFALILFQTDKETIA
ncbi:GNAT family N-acetyltransferase [Rhodobacteraceae bacterium B1Z28]|uniref:GNAT family N-acetyltransferase n=2 Tax=Ruegeria haliotis TaxID=2747601 RepID=A0ABX2PW34_9RHOB|nr:GNAT family N-acetyltransferase [Ruegeria haliotis]